MLYLGITPQFIRPWVVEKYFDRIRTHTHTHPMYLFELTIGLPKSQSIIDGKLVRTQQRQQQQPA